jgi:hypothetical protein
MIYCVIPPELEGELFEKLTAHYSDDPNVTVIVDRRKGERRRRGEQPPDITRRQVRDRRQKPTTGGLGPLEDI